MQGYMFLTWWMYSDHFPLWKHFVLNVTDWWCCVINWSTDHPEIPSTLPHYSSNTRADCSDTCWIKYCTTLQFVSLFFLSATWLRTHGLRAKRPWRWLNRFNIFFTQACFLRLKTPEKRQLSFPQPDGLYVLWALIRFRSSRWVCSSQPPDLVWEWQMVHSRWCCYHPSLVSFRSAACVQEAPVFSFLW